MKKPIVRLVHNLLLESIKREASDIHIRPISNGVQVLFRIHGKLVPIKKLWEEFCCQQLLVA